MGTKWRNEYRRCERCKTEYRPQRRAQSSRDRRRQAAYGRERFEKGTKGRVSVGLRDPSQLFYLSVGELPCASEKVDVVDPSASVSS
jgi:hypothetical protein